MVLRLLLALVPAMVIPFGAALFYFLLCPDAAVSRWAYWGVKVYLVAWPLVATHLFLRDEPLPFTARRARAGHALYAGLVSGLGMSVLILAAMLTPLGDLVHATAGSMRERAAHLGIMKYYIPFALFLSFVHSLVEEYYWRGFVYRRVRTVLTKAPAALLASLAFASHHVIITGQLMSWPLAALCGTGIAVGGLVWSYQYERHRTLLAPWLSHMLVDLTVMAIGWWVLRGS